MDADGLLETAADDGGILPERRRRRGGGRRQVPVATLPEPAPERPPEGPPRQELAHPAEEGLLAGDEARGEELRQDGIVQNGAQGTGRQDRLDLRREQQLPVAARVVERLDPEAVPRPQHPPPP